MSRAAGYVGRFAPTPSGDLHLGSLYTAAASYLDARAHGGRWLLRIEDVDAPRAVPGSAERIIATLQRFGFEWDGAIMRQSGRSEHYRTALQALRDRGLTFECTCSRSQLEDEQCYPGTCRALARPAAADTATRLRVEPGFISFADEIQGTFRQNVAATVGDLIIKRRDQVFAYLLAVVIDDAAQGVNHVVRGADLLDNTPRQIYLQRRLGVATPRYAHVPVLTEADDTKLAKSRRSVRADSAAPLSQLLSVFSLLGMTPPAQLQSAQLADAWRWAIANWTTNAVPNRLNLRITS
jgi:glutamyl-Q tRNA(Asp) synthetase